MGFQPVRAREREGDRYGDQGDDRNHDPSVHDLLVRMFFRSQIAIR